MTTIVGVGVAVAGLLAAVVTDACGRPAEMLPSAVPAAPQHVVLVTIDTLRADRVGAYGHQPARTPVLDAIAARGLRVDRAFATAPITLPSHASMFTGRYPPAHGARHNGIAMTSGQPTLAGTLKAAGFSTGAFVSAFPLDRRFGLSPGFDVYADRLPRRDDGRPADERPGQDTVDEALAWVRSIGQQRFFLWVHLFEPHAPYGRPDPGRPASARYDDEVAEADRQVGRLLGGLGPVRESALVVVTADHGESFGEHGEVGHSVFVYDTTLRVPLVVQGPRVPIGVVAHDVSLVDVAPTILALVGVSAPQMDGRPFVGAAVVPDPARVIYAESEAPFEDFGWSPLRAVRSGGLKYIEAPTPELYDLSADPAEQDSVLRARPRDADRLRAAARQVAGTARARVGHESPSAETRRRLQSLGYLSGGRASAGQMLVDPKDRRELAARFAEVASGELTGAVLETALRRILSDDPGNLQARLRLGYALASTGRCRDALPHFRAAIAAGMPTADAHLGLAGCLAGARAFDAAARALQAGLDVEPGNAVVVANQGTVLSDGGQPAKAVPFFQRALALDPDFHQARFLLAIALARAGQRTEAAREGEELLRRLPAHAPQRAEVARLLDAVR